MTPAFTNSALDNAWPFWVLGLAPSASNVDIEKAAQKTAAKLRLGAAGAEIFATPAGPRKRDEFLIREAKARLQNPATRLIAEFWYLPPESSGETLSSEHIASKHPSPQKKRDTEFWLSAMGLGK